MNDTYGFLNNNKHIYDNDMNNNVNHAIRGAAYKKHKMNPKNNIKVEKIRAPDSSDSEYSDNFSMSSCDSNIKSIDEYDPALFMKQTTGLINNNRIKETSNNSKLNNKNNFL
jgi:hypothetical protein